MAAVRPWRSDSRMTVHAAIDGRTAGEALSQHRAMFTVRVIGLTLLVVLSPIYGRIDAVPLALAVAFLAGIVAIQVRAFRSRDVVDWGLIALVGLVSDAATAYLAGLALAGGTGWVVFISYPLIALEGAAFFGMRGAVTTSIVSVFVYFGQTWLRAEAGIERTNVLQLVTVASFFLIHAIFLGLSAQVTRRTKADLATLLTVSALLSGQESPTRIVQALDARLRDLLGARVRSVALRTGSSPRRRWQPCRSSRVATSGATSMRDGQ